MSVNWYWKHKVGEIIYRDKEHNQKWKLEMFGGNMMCAFIYRYTKVNEDTGKREKWYTFFTFFNDINHAKRYFKKGKIEDFAIKQPKVVKVRLKISSTEYKYSNKEMLQLAKLLVNKGYRVELY